MFTASLSRDEFLRDYWQKKPVVIQSALPGFTDPLTPEELAGLACEDSVESRLIKSSGEHWAMQTGPLAESAFTSINDRDWTLLVQAVDQWIPEVRQLLDMVDFLPAWRKDDVMVSFAETGGGVGPHFDYYDVFIIQGQGQRKWQIGQACDASTALDTSSGLKILEHFHSEQEFILNSGDILYIPPMIAHEGTSLDSSLSYSIGFRAPSVAEMLLDYSDELCAELADDKRYRDRVPQDLDAPDSGEISSAVLENVTQLINSAINQPGRINRWFGKLVTAPRYAELIAIPETPYSAQELDQQQASLALVFLNAGSRVAFTRLDGQLLLFADGTSFELPQQDASTALLEILCRASYEDELDLSTYWQDSNCRELILGLLNQGTLLVDSDTE